MSADTTCFTCGLPLGEPLRLNHLSNGTVCPTCRDRLLDCLPAPLPASPGSEERPQTSPAAPMIALGEGVDGAVMGPTGFDESEPEDQVDGYSPSA